jgi:hypothetical protein
MSDIEPTYKNIGHVDQNGANMGDIIKSIYNLWKAVAAICNNLDEDNGTPGCDYMGYIGTDLNTAMTNLHTPTGAQT